MCYSSDKLINCNILEMSTIFNTEIIYIDNYYIIQTINNQYYFQVRN